MQPNPDNAFPVVQQQTQESRSPAESRWEAYGDLVRILYGTDERGWRSVGYGYATAVMEGVPCFRRFYLYGWAHQRVYCKGALSYAMFPWKVAYTRLTPWQPLLEPLIFSPEVFGDKQGWWDWVKRAQKELGLDKI